MTNPAGAPNQLLGVFHPDLVGIQVRVLQRLGSRHVMVVHGMDGMDEISISEGTYIAELKDGKVSVTLRLLVAAAPALMTTLPVGGWLSTTVTVNEQGVLRLAASVTV